ncbi:MAG: M48 family metallopeptidase [Verrucomicrobiota bacterium]|nr:M48 family metallopeptidase [Verrucomicrobiota bacterium]
MNRRNFLRLIGLTTGATAATSSLNAFNIGGVNVPVPLPTEITGGVNVDKVAEGSQKIAKGATGIGAKEEAAIGEAVAIGIIGKNGGLARASGPAQKIIYIGKSLAKYSYRPGLNFRFGVLNSSIVNGFSSPGGYVFITKGLLDAVGNDDQLAGVLAHEICHITRRHALQTISRGQLVSGIVDVASGSSSDFSAFDAGTDKIVNKLLDTGFDPDDEYDADKFGAKLAYETGYSKNGLKDFLEKLKSTQGDSKKIFSTHPPLSNRISKLS